MQSEAIRLTLGTFKEEESYWIGVIFINHRIRARVYHNDTFSNLMQRVSFFNNLHQLTFVLGIEPEYTLGLKQYTEEHQKMGQEYAKEEKKKSKKHKEESEDSEETGEFIIPEDVITEVGELIAEQFYLVVYLR